MPVPGSYFYLQSKRQQPSGPTSSSEVYPVTSVCDFLSLSLVYSSRQQPLETTIRALPENPEGAATGIISSGEVCSVMSRQFPGSSSTCSPRGSSHWRQPSERRPAPGTSWIPVLLQSQRQQPLQTSTRGQVCPGTSVHNFPSPSSACSLRGGSHQQLLKATVIGYYQGTPSLPTPGTTR